MAEAALRQLPITNMKGLHARAAAKFVKIAEQYEAQVTVRKVCAANDATCDPDASATGTSILGLMMLGAECGSQVSLQASGHQAEQMLDALEQLILSKFGEAE